MKTTRFSALLLLLVSLLGFASECTATLFGPWRRYRNEELGFQIPYVDDWVITPLKNCVVFAMQMNPDPYVRLAVGRIQSDRTLFEESVEEQLSRSNQSMLTRTRTELNGLPAIRVEGKTSTGHVLDYYVDRGDYRYWISVVADGPESWDEYSKSIDIILSEFRFL
jgi:hypothetical protein